MRLPRLFPLVLLPCLASLPSQAQEGSSGYSFRLRGGYQVAPSKDALGQPLFALTFGREWQAGAGWLQAEAGFQMKPGREFHQELASMQRANAVRIDAAFSLESRQNKLEGLILRLGYQGPLAGDWSWRAGLQVGGARFSHQVIGQVSDGDASAGAATYADTYYATPTKTSLGLSPYGGLGYRLDATSSLEFGLLFQSYTALNYQHVAGTRIGSFRGNSEQDRLGEHRRLLPHLELTYAFRF